MGREEGSRGNNGVTLGRIRRDVSGREGCERCRLAGRREVGGVGERQGKQEDIRNFQNHMTAKPVGRSSTTLLVNKLLPSF